jgi:hypothetical protein
MTPQAGPRTDQYAEEYTEPPGDVRTEMHTSVTLGITAARTILHTLQLLDEFLRCHAGPTTRAELHAFTAAQGWAPVCGTAAFYDSIGLTAQTLHHAITTTAHTDSTTTGHGTGHNDDKELA